MNTNQCKHFWDVMLKLDFIFVYYYYDINSLLKNVFHKHNENRNENVTDLSVRTKNNG